jgi:TM2 domain-containing membrane protein YozV
MAVVLLLVLAAIALGIIGAVVKGLLYLLVVGICVFAIALLLGAVRFRRGGRRPAR